ncbi:phosphoethanolamine transferase [Arenibacter latericius]|uniref:phosphoethanolamine transferase n=1 Tax=Arenibacter latericius TaxID=86104 RepID=UPI0003F6A9CD|nr:phosphoethanolamine transferase [Arenibacter latericius]
MFNRREIVKTIELLYPPYLVLLVLAPIIIGFFIDYDLSDSFSLVVNLIWMLVFTIPYVLFRKEFIYRIALCVYFVIGFIEIGHWITMEGPLTITSLLIVSNTNYEEALSFLDMKSTWGFVMLILYTAVFIMALRKSSKGKTAKYKLVHIGAVVMVFGLIIFSLRNSIPKYRFLPQSAKISYTLINELSDYKKAGKENVLKKVDVVFHEDPNQQQTFVLIIGETCSRNHMSLYGANVNTNPRLSNRDDIIKYTDVVSAYNYTFESIPAMLSQSSLDKELDIAERVDVLDVFYSAGFETYWISNQSPIGIWDNVISGMARKSDNPKFVNTNSNSSQEAILSRAYDENLFEPFKLALEDSSKHKFIVLHLMGSHNTYSKRYPPEFSEFKNDGSKRERLIAEYRNSILYNDFVVDSLLTILERYSLTAKDDISSAIYVADHGENVYDEMDRIGHDYSNEMPKVLVEIPFVVWLSPEYLKQYKRKATSIVENKDMPYVTDYLFHSILDINKLKSPLLEESKSVFNNNFDYTRERILVDGKDYDRE